MFCENPQFKIKNTKEADRLFKTKIDKMVYLYKYISWWENSDSSPYSADDFKHATVVPCGKCLLCRKDHWHEWWIRCYLEAREYTYNQFITLTYDDKHLPENGVDRYAISRFIKNVREHFRIKRKHVGIRFYGCGTYDENNRPHYHVLLFNCPPFRDEKFYKKNKQKQNLYTSKIIASCWGKGFCTVGGVTRHTCQYVAKYVLENYNRAFPRNISYPFQSMSTQPGIGNAYLERHFDELLADDAIQITATIKERLPRYYERMIAKRIGAERYAKEIAEPRAEKAKAAIAAEMERTGLSEEELLRKRIEKAKTETLKIIKHYEKKKGESNYD